MADRRPTRTLVLLVLIGVLAAVLAVAFTHRTAETTSPDAASTLDPSGRTIPDSDYPLPGSRAVYLSVHGDDAGSGGVDAPVRTLDRAIALVPDRGTIVVRGGTDAEPYVYRDWYSATNARLQTQVIGLLTKSVTFQAYPHEKAWFDGTDIVATAKWTSDGNGHFSTPWSTPSFCGTSARDRVSEYYSRPLGNQLHDGGPCAHPDMSLDPTNPLANDPQLVYIDDHYVRQVRSLDAVGPGEFYYERTARRIAIGVDPAGHTVELAARPAALFLNAASSKILGLGFRRYASNEFSGTTRAAVYNGGVRQVFENDVFTQMAATGLGLSQGDGTLVNHSVFAANGFDGVRGPGGEGGLVFTNNVVNANNAERFGTGCTYSCSNAGMKISAAHGFTLRANIFTDNIGEGFWCDLDCSGATIVDNVFRHNTRSGLTYEVSDDAVIASNLVVGNGLYGVRIASAHVRVYNNTVVDNGGAQIWVYDDKRVPARGAAGPNTTATSVVNNVISGRSVAVLAQGTNLAQTSPADPGFFAALDHNSYRRVDGPQQLLFRWVTPAGTTDYRSIGSLRADYGTLAAGDTDDTGDGDALFVDAGRGDYRLRAGSSARAVAAVLPDDVRAAVRPPFSFAPEGRGVLVWTRSR